MRKLRLFIIPFLLSMLFFNGCKKNMVDEQFKPIVNPVIPDFATQVNASVHGFITDENGEAVEAASITTGAITVTTDEFGYFKISNAPFAKSAGFIQVQQAGYFTGYRTFLPVAGKETFIRLQLIPKTTAGTIESVAGGTVTLGSGATVMLPADAVVVASNNNPYSGDIHIAAHWYDPADMETTSLTMPGDLTGVDSAGHLNVLQTFGMLAVELTGSSGESLQMATGKKASLHFPLPASIQSIAPANIPLWYFDEIKGVWKQEGYAVKNGNSYDGLVSHFSYWNCDIGLALARFSAQVVDTGLNPLSNVPIVVTIDGQANTSRVSYSDYNGEVNGWVPANSNLEIIIPAPCNQAITIKTVSVVNEPIDLGTVKVNLNEFSAVLEGSVTKCNGSPVTDGSVIVTGFGKNSIINITNGSFSVAGIFCPGTYAKFIALDRETTQRSDISTVQLVSGTNSTGTLQACTSTGGSESITYEFTAGSPITFALPQYLFGGNFYFLNDSTSINAIDLLNSNQQVIQFSFVGPAAAGSFPISNNRIMIDGTYYTFNQPTSATITSYGLVGQFITGYFGGVVSPINQNLVVSFNIKRDQ